MIRILLSDDNAAFRQSSREQGAAIGIEVVAFDDWESAQVALDGDFDSFNGVIVDGKGRLRDSAKAEDAKHLTTAIGWLKEQRGRGRHVPVVIYTGFHAEIESFTSTDSQILRVFDKSKHTFVEVIDFLKVEIAKSPIEKLKSKHPDVYNFAKKFFSEENQQIILKISQDCVLGSNDFMWKKNTLEGLRRLNETLVDNIPLNFYEPKYELRDFIEKVKREGNPKASMGNRAVAIIDYFHNNKLQVPGPVFSTVKNIYYTASAYAAHNDENQTDYYPSSEMILGLVYSHFGCYHWFNSIIKD